MLPFPAQLLTSPWLYQQEWQQQAPPIDTRAWTNGYLFSSDFVPVEDLQTIDASLACWHWFSKDVSTAQQTMAEAKELEHSRCAGMDILQRVKHNCSCASRKQELAAVLADIQEELAEQGAINSRLQAGIADSFEALGAYMSGTPAAHHQHRQQVAHTRGFTGQGPAIQQFQGMEMAGGFSVPPADERPGNMSANDYLSTLAPKLLAMQELRQHPFAPRSIHKYQTQDSMCMQEPPRMQGMYRLRELLAAEWEPRQRLELETAMNKLLGEYYHKDMICRRLWFSFESLSRCLQWYITSSLALRWHTRWLAGEQMDQPADWIYSTLKSRALGQPLVCYQIWLHDRSSTASPYSNASTPNTSPNHGMRAPYESSGKSPGSPTVTGHNHPGAPTSLSGKPGCPGQARAVQATFCIASGTTACDFMWFRAPNSWAVDVPGVARLVLGPVGGSFGTPASSPTPGAKAVVISSPKPPKPFIPAPKAQAVATKAAGSPSDAAKAPAPSPRAAKLVSPSRLSTAAHADAGSSNTNSSSNNGATSPKKAHKKKHRNKAQAAGSVSNKPPAAGKAIKSARPVSAPVSGRTPGSAAQQKDSGDLVASQQDTSAGSAAPASAAAQPTAGLVASKPSTEFLMSAAGSYAAAAVTGMVRATITAPKQSVIPRRVSTEPPAAPGSIGSSGGGAAGQRRVRASRSFNNGRPSSPGGNGSGWSPRGGKAGRMSEGSRGTSILQQFKAAPAPQAQRTAGRVQVYVAVLNSGV